MTEETTYPQDWRSFEAVAKASSTKQTCAGAGTAAVTSVELWSTGAIRCHVWRKQKFSRKVTFSTLASCRCPIRSPIRFPSKVSSWQVLAHNKLTCFKFRTARSDSIRPARKSS